MRRQAGDASPRLNVAALSVSAYAAGRTGWSTSPPPMAAAPISTIPQPTRRPGTCAVEYFFLFVSSRSRPLARSRAFAVVYAAVISPIVSAPHPSVPVPSLCPQEPEAYRKHNEAIDAELFGLAPKARNARQPVAFSTCYPRGHRQALALCGSHASSVGGRAVLQSVSVCKSTCVADCSRSNVQAQADADAERDVARCPRNAR